MSKFINFRAFLYIVITAVLSCVTAVLACVHTIGIILFFSLFFIIAFLVIFLRIKLGAHTYFITAVLCLFVSAITFVNCINIYSSWCKDGFVDGDSYVINGKIESISDYSDNAKITINDLTFYNEKVDGTLQFYCDMTINGYSEVKLGYKVELYAKVYDIPLISNSVNGSAYRNDLRYVAYADSINFVPDEMSFLQRLHQKIFDLFIINMGEENASIAYGMLTGNKGRLDSEINDNFSASGLGHILAVSGLHIGFLVTLISFILDRLKLKRAITVTVMSVLLFLYAGFVGFSPSVMRAVFMSVIGMLTIFTDKRYDILNSLFFAASVLIAANPFYLFEVGFLMSFGAVFGIVLFAPVFNRALRKIKIPKFISLPLSSGIAVQIGIIPAMVYYYNFIQTYSIIVNVLLIPVLSIVYMALLISTVFALVFPFGSWFIYLVGVCINCVNFVAEFVAKLPLSTITIYSFLAVFFCYPLYFIISEFVNIPRIKVLVSCLASGICVMLLVIPSIAMSQIDRSETLSYVEKYGEVTSIFTDSDNKVYLIGDINDYSAVRTAMTKLKFKKIDYVFTYKIDYDTAVALKDVAKKYMVKAIYCQHDMFDNVADMQDAIKVLRPLYEYDSDVVQPLFVGEEICGYYFNATAKTLTLKRGFDYVDLDVSIINSVQVLRVDLFLNKYHDRIYVTNLPIGYLGEEPMFQLSTNSDDFLTLSLKNGKIFKN